MALPLRNGVFGVGVAVCMAGAAWAMLSESKPIVADANLSTGPNLAAAPKEPAAMSIARTTGINLDGDFDDPGWNNGAKTGAFVDELGVAARPYTDARVAWGDGMLYVGFYSADENIITKADRPDGPLWLADDVHLAVSVGDHEYSIDAAPSGTITDGVRINGGPADYSWSSGAHIAKEMDGTLNDPSDNDEEWLIELAIPLQNLGLQGKPGESFGVRMRRCDTSKSLIRSCATAEPTRVEFR